MHFPEFIELCVCQHWHQWIHTHLRLFPPKICVFYLVYESIFTHLHNAPQLYTVNPRPLDEPTSQYDAVLLHEQL